MKWCTSDHNIISNKLLPKTVIPNLFRNLFIIEPEILNQVQGRQDLQRSPSDRLTFFPKYDK